MGIAKRMPSETYSFLDVAVLDTVRQRFAAGDAIAILAADLEQVIWANGPGAALFGYSDIEAIIGASARLPLIARRQIMATSGFPAIGRDRAITVRLASGLTSRAIGFLATAVTMPDGESAIMLALPAPQAGSRSAAEIAGRAISGFTEDGHHIAFVDARGEIEASSSGFSALGITRETLAALVAEVATDPHRIVRRIVSGKAAYPAGLARLTEQRHLLMVIDEDLAEEPAREATTTADKPTIVEDAAGESEPLKLPAETAPTAEATEAPQGHSGDEARTTTADMPTVQAPAATEGDGTTNGSAQHDHWYFNAGDDADQPRETAPLVAAQTVTPPPPADHPPRQPAASAPRPIDRQAAPIRFVWLTDEEGRFSSLSPEFTAIVGKAAADVIGRRFRDVATTFGLDPSGEIAGLLERRDTWSGRSVQWPVAGTDLKIPVDLAALPVYGRNREFKGFRGFGVARTGDAMIDPEAIGMALVPNGQPPAPTAPEATISEEPTPNDPFKGEVPALTIVPKPERRFADKVIRLAEHRQPGNDKGAKGSIDRELSVVERSAFREIGERLRKDSSSAAEAGAADKQLPAEGAPARTAASAPHETPTHPAEPSPPQAGEPVPPASSEARPDGSTEKPPEQAASPPPETRPGVAGSGTLATETAAPSGQDEPVAANDDSMTADDFRDAEDNEEWAQSDDGAPADKDTGKAEIPAAAHISQPAPAPKTDGFLPSAFSSAEATAPDTSILSKLPVPLLIHSGDALHYANEEFLALTGYDTLAELAEAGGIGALFADPYADDEASDGTDHALHMRARDGQEFPIEAILRSVPWLGGKALMLVVRRSGDDETATAPHFMADDPAQPDIAELKTRIAEMRTIIDTATDGVVLIGRDGTIRSISRPAEALFGFDSDEVAGKSFASLFAIESQRAAQDYLAGLSEPGVASVLNDGREVIGREAQGRFIPLFMTIGRLPNDSGFCAVVRDITQWKRAEEDLTQARAVAERASSQKTEFLARISHEIRTPLNAIIGFSELMVDEKFGPVANDRYRDYLRDINRSGNHVLDLVNDLLDISKIEAGQQEMDYEAVSLNDTLAETVAMMQPQANRERVIIRSSFASRLPDVVADLRSVRQIALNILSNAIRYTQAGGQVIVSTAYESSGDVAMRVRDTGIGMSQAEIEQALKPFKQINALKRGRGDGTGLGLPLTKAMVEANRARFTITSTPGEGTLVEVAFPSTRVLAE